MAQDKFGIGQVHSSYYLVEPVAHSGWSVQVIPIVEDDNTRVVLFKAVLSTYEGLGAIYVPPVLNKHILITDTGLDIVCGPLGEVCLLLRKLGYSEHCVYTGAMLSFICILFWFLEIQFWEVRSLWLKPFGSNPRGQVVLVFPVTTLQWLPG